jgi:hypothetical protein
MKTWLLFLSCFSPVTFVFSQSAHESSLANEQQLDNIIGLYDQYMFGNEPIVNGSQYIFYALKMKGDPYLGNGDFARGWITYEGKKYDSLNMVYDISRNELVFLNDNRPIVVHNESVDSFFLLGHLFVNFRQDTKNLGRVGYCDILYRGKIQLLVKRDMTFADVIEDNTVVRAFSLKDRYYIYKGGNYYLLNKLKDVFDILPDKRRELKTFVHQNHMRMQHADFELKLTKLTAFYDQISQ